MLRDRKFICTCCTLDHSEQLEFNAPVPTICVRCRAHAGSDVWSLRERDRVHIELWKDREQRAFDRMRSAYGSRATALRALSQINELHELRADGFCKCKSKQCRVGSILAEPNVNRLVDGYYKAEERRLRQLRYTDEDEWADEWDEIIPPSFLDRSSPVADSTDGGDEAGAGA